MSRGQRFESARRLSLFGVDKSITRNSGRFDRTKVGFLTPIALSSAGVEPFMSRAFALYKYGRKGKKNRTDLTCDSVFELISTGSWESQGNGGVLSKDAARTL
jgi:hypothetical protein